MHTPHKQASLNIPLVIPTCPEQNRFPVLVECNDAACPVFEEGSVYLQEKGVAIFGRGGCGLNIAKLKENYSSIQDLKLTMDIVGEVFVRIGLWRDFHSFVWLAERRISSKENGANSIPINIEGLTGGYLEVHCKAVEESVIFQGAYESTAFCKDRQIGNTLEDLAEMVFPSLDLCTEEPLYFRLDQDAHYSYESKVILLNKGGSAKFDTYFNTFSLDKWLKYTSLSSLGLKVTFKGKIVLSLGIHHAKDSTEWIKSVILESPSQQTTLVNIPFPILSDGLLFIQCSGLDKSVLYGASFCTYDKPAIDIRLGIAITTFKREPEVRKTASRLTSQLANDIRYKDKIKLVIVDNGQTLSPEDVSGATLLPNRNLGGAGGFTRGLIHLQEQGGFSHCLFMDDDASCEVESIRRAYNFLRYSNKEGLAISGGMLREAVRFIQHENGAYFNGSCRPLKCGLDLRNVDALIQNEEEEQVKGIYGAWWFFMFPIAAVKKYTFPYFVRGDDIIFSHINPFKIVTLNGISCWQEDFWVKQSPMTLYLDTRSHAVHFFVSGHLTSGLIPILKMFWHFFGKFNASYHYSTARAIIQAFKDIQRGPSYWLNNMDMANKRKEISELAKNEAPVFEEIPATAVTVEKTLNTKILPKFIRRLTLNGHLLPRRFIESKTTWHIPKSRSPWANGAYRREKMVIFDEVNGKLYYLARSPKRYLRNMAAAVWWSLVFLVRFPQIRAAYLKDFDQMTSKSFWDKQF